MTESVEVPANGSAAIRVAIADDHHLVSEGLSRLLAGAAEVTVVGIADTASSAGALVNTVSPDVALLDRGLPDEDGVKLGARLLRSGSRARLILLTGQLTDPDVLDALDAGFAGALQKTCTVDELVRAIVVVAGGGTCFPDQQLARLLSERRRKETSHDLTAREIEIVQLLAEGTPVRGIAAMLHLSEHTVRNHIQRALGKLGAHSQLEAVALAIKQGLIRRS